MKLPWFAKKKNSSLCHINFQESINFILLNSITISQKLHEKSIITCCFNSMWFFMFDCAASIKHHDDHHQHVRGEFRVRFKKYKITHNREEMQTIYHLIACRRTHKISTDVLCCRRVSHSQKNPSWKAFSARLIISFNFLMTIIISPLN